MKMPQSDENTTDWLKRITERELPAFSATVRALEQLEHSDTASLASLGRTVLHDHGLTTRILRVVNSAIYRRSHRPVTTVSRASVILGYDTLKHICLTATMIDGLLGNREITPAVHQRLLTLMAQSLHAAMLAKMLMAGYHQDTREEIYIATLLRHLGEIAFWSVGGQAAEQLDATLRQQGTEPATAIKDMLGMSFDQLGLALARSWHMGSMLIKAMTDPQRRSPEMRCISLAQGFSQALLNGNHAGMQRYLRDMAAFLGESEQLTRERIERCTEDAAELAACYGASDIARRLLPARDDWADPQAAMPYHTPDATLQLKMLREMLSLAAEQNDINLLIHTTLEGLLRAVGMDSVMVLMPSPGQGRLNPRFFASIGQQTADSTLSLSLAGDDVITRAFRQKKNSWCHRQAGEPAVPAALAAINPEAPFLLAPLLVNHKTLGLFYGDRAQSQRALTEEDADAFYHFVRQASQCLSEMLA